MKGEASRSYLSLPDEARSVAKAGRRRVAASISFLILWLMLGRNLQTRRRETFQIAEEVAKVNRSVPVHIVQRQFAPCRFTLGRYSPQPHTFCS